MRDDFLEEPGVQDFLNRMGECFARGHAMLRASFANERWAPSRSARPATMHAFTMSEAKAEFADDPEFRYRENNQLKTLLSPTYEFRVKKANSRFRRVGLNKTRRTRRWTQLPLSVPGLQQPDRLFLAYSISRDWLTLKEFAILEFDGGKVVDAIIMPFDEDPPVAEGGGDGFITPRFRLNAEGMRRLRQQELLEMDDESEFGS